VTPQPTPSDLPDVQLNPAAKFGVYVHVPFCLTRCGYCDSSIG
jgi:coproporphyrinogen III oxidase-like Fe-S oxidoreductase